MQPILGSNTFYPYLYFHLSFTDGKEVATLYQLISLRQLYAINVSYFSLFRLISKKKKMDDQGGHGANLNNHWHTHQQATNLIAHTEG
jgi:hypothetical protein